MMNDNHSSCYVAMYTLPPLLLCYTSVIYSLVYKVIIVNYVLIYWWCIQSGAVHIVSHRNDYVTYQLILMYLRKHSYMLTHGNPLNL